jgi:membrane protein
MSKRSAADGPGTAGQPATAGEAAVADANRPVPEKPTQLSRRSWLAAAKRSGTEFGNDVLQDRAAALTYYGVLAIFPALLAMVSLLGLIGRSATQPLITSLAQALPSSVRQIFLTAVRHLQHSHASAGVLAVVGIVTGLWSASSYIAAFMRASNAIYKVPEGRPFWKTTPIRIGVTVAMLAMLIASGIIVVVTGGLARHAGQLLGISSVAVTVWNIAKWPVLLIFVSLMLALLYWASPNARQGFRWLSPGAVVAVVGWLAASGLFSLYLANFGHYNKVYGSIAAVIIFLIWLWITNSAILFGAEFNAQLQRGQAMAAGIPPDTDPFAELRDTTKLRKKARRKAARRKAARRADA